MRWLPFDLHGILLEIREDIGWIKSRLQSNTERLDRIESRVYRKREPFQVSDLMPALWGIAVLALAASGKIEWAAVAGLLSPGR